MIKKKPVLIQLSLFIVLVFFCTLLTGCPQEIDPALIQSGELYDDVLCGALHSRYDINFSNEDTPTVSISYQIIGGSNKIAVFKLDGYDETKKIGYKLIKLGDEDLWYSEIKNGNLDVPDLAYYHLIQTAALEYDYPIIFIDVSEYQEDTDYDSLSNNEGRFFDELNYSILISPTMVQWLEANSQ